MTGDIWLLFGLADNVNVEGANVTVELTNNAGTDLTISNDLGFWDSNMDAINNNITSKSGKSRLVPTEIWAKIRTLLQDQCR